MSQRAPLSDLTFSLVGPGKVGASLASWAVARGAEALAFGVHRESDAARALAGRLDCVTVPISRLKTEGQDLLLVAVPDPALDQVAQILGRRKQAAVALHTSGSRDASALAPLQRQNAGSAESWTTGTEVGSLHPLKAFPRPLLDPETATGVLFGIDGDGPAREMARRLAHAWRAQVVEVPPKARLLYHFAATLAAGGVVTLMAAAAELADRAGLPREVLAGYFELARGALEQAAAAEDPAAAVTGPVARGDRQTVLAELESVADTAPEMLPTFIALAQESLRQRRRDGSLSAEAERLAQALDERFETAISPVLAGRRGRHDLS